MPHFTILIVMAAGAGAGCLGALFGIGGGVFLVPFLNLVIGIPLTQAAGISLSTVIATSSVVSSDPLRQSAVNVRLALLLQIASSAGGLTGGIASRVVSEETLQWLFAAVMAAVAALMFSRLNRRNVLLDPAADPGWLGGRFHEEESGGSVVYQLRRLPLGVTVAFAAGVLSALLGIGGGVVIVPALIAWCGVPIRAAAATSTLMIGITAVSSLPIYYAHGDVPPHLAAAAVLGVLAGSRIGLIVGVRARARSIKMMMAAVLLAVSLIYVLR